MDYKRFRPMCIIRVELLVATLLVFSYLLYNTSLYATLALVGVAVVYQTYAQIRYIERTNRDLTRFLESIEHADFSQTFTQGLKGPSFDELNAAFAKVFERFRAIRREKEEHFRYLQTVVQHVGIGLIAFQDKGEVELINTAAKRLFDIPHLKNIHELGRFSEELVSRLKSLPSGGQDLVEVRVSERKVHLSVHAIELRFQNRRISLVSLQNISTELGNKEMEAWQNMVRVVTHEIKNSLTPIASLAATVDGLLCGDEISRRLEGLEAADDMRDALGTIQRRSEGLLRFIDAYRKMTHIPAPQVQAFLVADLFNVVEDLMRSRLEEKGISLRSVIEPESLELVADRHLIEQVLINLFTNAIQALDGRADGCIEISAGTRDRGRVLIRVEDNGPGIDEDALDRIFVPFFSTRPGGSGIGLTLSRRILRIHGGDITVRSIPGEPTAFLLTF
ncbi:MAG: ATP-binding protein [Planctomycetota bacterium]